MIDEERARYQREYRRRNLARCRAAEAKYREKNRERIRKQSRDSKRREYQRNPEKFRVRNAKNVAKGSNRQYYARHNAAEHSRHLRGAYGIDGKAYAEMLQRQRGLCAICVRPETALGRGGKPKRLAVDHCHVTGTIRALLCDRCNRLIGYAEESVTTLRAAAEYLESYNAAD